MELQIIAIRKDNGNHHNLHEAVSHYKWRKADGEEGISNRVDTVAWAKKTGNQAYVASGASKVYCEVRSNGRIEFLQTISNNRETDNLLELPPC